MRERTLTSLCSGFPRSLFFCWAFGRHFCRTVVDRRCFHRFWEYGGWISPVDRPSVMYVKRSTSSPKFAKNESFSTESSTLNIPRPIVFHHEQFASNNSVGQTNLNAGSTTVQTDNHYETSSQIPSFINSITGLLTPSASYCTPTNSLHASFDFGLQRQRLLTVSAMTPHHQQQQNSSNDAFNRMMVLQDLALRASAFRPIPRSTPSETAPSFETMKNSNFATTSTFETMRNSNFVDVASTPVDYSTKSKIVSTSPNSGGQRKRTIVTNSSSDDLVLEAVKKFFAPHSKTSSKFAADNSSTSSELSTKGGSWTDAGNDQAMQKFNPWNRIYEIFSLITGFERNYYLIQTETSSEIRFVAAHFLFHTVIFA